MNTVFVILLVAVLATLTHCADPDYYWRDYWGIIPKDAVVANKESNGIRLYIGQVPIEKHGLYVGTIHRGHKKVVVAASDGKQKSSLEFVKILCTGKPENFKWVATDSGKIRDTTSHLVEGGHENIGDNPGILYIGKVKDGDEIKIGSIVGYKDDAELIMPKVKEYEVLVYEETTQAAPENTGDALVTPAENAGT